MEPVDIQFFSQFNEDSCTLCGECFHKCPIMGLTIEESVEEMKRLIYRQIERHKEAIKELEEDWTELNSRKDGDNN